MELSFQIKNDLADLNILRGQLQALQSAWSLPAKTVTEINLVMEEIIVNIIQHGDHTRQNLINITLKKEGEELTMTVADNGPSFDPTNCASPDTTLPLQQRKCGGLGIHLVRTLCSCCSYARANDSNVFTVKKNLPKECR
jgi:serine/threonine-protein kinase RsbW